MKRAGRWLWRAVQLVVLALLGWALWHRLAPELARVRPEDLTRWRPAPGPLLLSFALLLGVYGLTAFLWRRILRDISGRQANARATVKVFFLAGLGRYVPGKVWAVAGMAFLAGREGLPPLGATAAAALGQITFLTTGLLFLALVLPGYGGLGAGILAALAGLAALVAAVVFLSASGPGARLRHWVGHHVGERAARAFEIFDRIRPRTAILWGLGYLGAWALLGAAFTVFCAAFLPVRANALRVLAGSVAASYLAGYLVLVAPAGIGVREGVMTALLSTIMPAPAAVVVAVVSRVWFTAAEVLPLALVPLLPGGGPPPGAADGVDNGTAGLSGGTSDSVGDGDLGPQRTGGGETGRLAGEGPLAPELADHPRGRGREA